MAHIEHRDEVGSINDLASALAALFRTPLTASLLLFEVTRNYDAIMPLLASAGVASIVGELLDERFAVKDVMEEDDRRITIRTKPLLRMPDSIDEDDWCWRTEEGHDQDPRSEGTIVLARERV